MPLKSTFAVETSQKCRVFNDSTAAISLVELGTLAKLKRGRIIVGRTDGLSTFN